MHTELVERRLWMTHRSLGGVVAGALILLPSLFILIALGWIYLRFGDVLAVAGIFYGLEATHDKLGFTAPLSAITAAVIGVILNLAMIFAYHVLWPQGFGTRFDAVSAVITVAAAVALFRFKIGVMPLLGACAAIGLVVSLGLA